MSRAISFKHKNQKSRNVGYKKSMTEKLLEKKVDALRGEVAALRFELVGAGVIADKDPEGEYRSEFVREILAASRKKEKMIPFTTAEDFLRRVERYKSKKIKNKK